MCARYGLPWGMTRFSVVIYDTSARAILPPSHVGVDLPAAIGRACRETERLDDRPDVRRVAQCSTGSPGAPPSRWSARGHLGGRAAARLPGVVDPRPGGRGEPGRARAGGRGEAPRRGLRPTDSGDGSKADTVEGALPMPRFRAVPDPAALQRRCARLVTTTPTVGCGGRGDR